jgi:hypothetical protein
MRQEQGQTAWVGTGAAVPRLTCADSGRDWQMLMAQRMNALMDSNARLLSALNFYSALLEQLKPFLRDHVLEGIDRRLNALEARDTGAQVASGVNDALGRGPTQQQGWAPKTVLDILFPKPR